MKDFWKWIIGIVIVLVVLTALGVGSRFLLANYLPAHMVDFDGLRTPFSTGRGFDRYYNHMPFGGMMTFGGGTILLGWLIPLGLVGLLAYGAFRLGRSRATAPQAPLPPAAPIQVRTCTKCGKQVEEGWIHCAHCGRKL